tara:strand:- start:1030 stop:1239 length:210 start_codon:yes stop_codon:yes gene_type:complete
VLLILKVIDSDKNLPIPSKSLFIHLFINLIDFREYLSEFLTIPMLFLLLQENKTKNMKIYNLCIFKTFY